MKKPYYETVVKLLKKEYERRERLDIKLDLEHKVNLVQQFRETVRKNGDSPALMTRIDHGHEAGTWRVKTYNEFADLVDSIAAALMDAGIGIGGHVAIQSHTREEWTILDEAILATGAVVVCIYPTLAREIVKYQLDDSESVAIFLETEKHLKDMMAIKKDLPKIKLVVIIEDPSKSNPDFELPDWVVLYDDFIKKGRELLKQHAGLRDKIRELESKIDPDSLATIIYTSGTTGMPKGAMLTHWNIASNVIASDWVFPATEDVKRNLSFLPLSHSFERMAGHFYPIYEGMCTAFCSNIDNISRDLQEVRPNYLTGVPRVFEKIYAYAMEQVRSYSPAKQKVFYWAVKIGREYDEKYKSGQKIGIRLKLKIKLARALVFDKFIKMAGGELIFFVSGGASMPEELARFFGAVGLTIIEGYGLTETSPVTNVNHPLNVKYGWVGPALPGTEIKIAEDN
ncbi:MAG: AMP-dependent synthetase/ligase [Promethearchaeota archaeon]